jgi:hypothetical protein
MDFSNVLRHFGDVIQIDSALPLANKIQEMIKENSSKSLS